MDEYLNRESENNPNVILYDELSLAAFEFQNVCRYAGDDSEKIDPVFEKIVNLTSQNLFKKLQQKIHDQDSVLDLGQQVYMKVYKFLKKGGFVGDSQFGTYFYKVTDNILKDFYTNQIKRQKREVLKEELGNYSLTNVVDIDETIINNDLVESVKVFVKESPTISPRDKEMWYMRHFQGKTYVEVGLLFGLTAVAVKVAMSRTNNKIRKAL